MIGELKLTRKALDPKDFMINSSPTSNTLTVAHWHFASEEELLKDASKNGYHLQLLKHEIVSRDQAFKKAVADLWHHQNDGSVWRRWSCCLCRGHYSRERPPSDKWLCIACSEQHPTNLTRATVDP